MREIRQSGSAGGETQINEPSLPLSGFCPLNRLDYRDEQTTIQGPWVTGIGSDAFQSRVAS